MDVLAQEDTKQEAIPPLQCCSTQTWVDRKTLTMLRKSLLSFSWSLTSSAVLVTGIPEPSQYNVHKHVAQHL